MCISLHAKFETPCINECKEPYRCSFANLKESRYCSSIIQLSTYPLKHLLLRETNLLDSATDFHLHVPSVQPLA